jgi:hypothetical protein
MDMTSSEQRDAEQATRRNADQRTERERQLRRAIGAQHRLPRRRHGADSPIGREPDPRYAHLTKSHD